jgi:putative redox protein
MSDQTAKPPARIQGSSCPRRRDGFYGQEITVAGHRLVVDDPTGVRGTDTGPSPYDLLVTALGACTSMTVFSLCTQKAVATGGRNGTAAALEDPCDRLR